MGHTNKNIKKEVKLNLNSALTKTMFRIIELFYQLFLFQSQALKVVDENIVCGVKNISWNSDNSASHCQFFGRDFASVATSQKQCGTTCKLLENCTHFTWTTGENFSAMSAPKS
jgi:hypothetical protein